jgi:NADH-quinone oxidoreductase subunit E
MASMLTEDTRAEIDRWLAKYPPEQRQSAVLSALHAAQHQNGGWLSPELISAVAEYLSMPRIAVQEVATFYSMYETRPVGRHMVALCTNISCWLRGAVSLAEHVERKLGIKLGETTPDGRITLKKEEECLAACCGAPMMAVDGHYHENLTPEKVDAILDSLP